MTGEDDTAAEQFADRVLGLYTSGLLTFMIDLGHRTGLFNAAAEGPATSEELAARAGLNERYVREWLGAMASSRIFDYRPDDNRYSLPPAHAACLTGDGSANLARSAQLQTFLGRHLREVAQAFHHGGGVSDADFGPEFTAAMDALSRSDYDADLEDTVALVPGLHDALTAGARLADVGCGAGHAIALLAAAYPRSTFVGYDIAADAIDKARAEAAEAGLTNATFEVADAARLHVDQPFGAIVSFDAIHDQVDPAGVLKSIYDALVTGGTFLMEERHCADTLQASLDNPWATRNYAVSTLHCMTVSLAGGGGGLGCAAATRHSTPAAARNRANPNPIRPRLSHPPTTRNSPQPS